ncbi:hypothetical protein ACOME3_010144 [Neoechinorhynchus agilis]
MSPKQIDIRVHTMDADIDFCVLSNSTGKHLFDQVTKTIGLREYWWFGLQYIDSKNSVAWLRPTKKILNEDIKRGLDKCPLVVNLRAKFYPEDIAEEIIQDITLNLFFLQVKEQILSEDIYCPPETCVLLASYAIQATRGDIDQSRAISVLEKENLLPERVTSQHNLAPKQWAEKISAWWREHHGMAREDAMREYLKIAQDLEMYGVNYFPIMNKKKTELYLGVDALGLNIYDKNDKLVPKIGFPWSEISNIAYNDKKFVIRPADKKSKDFVFYVQRLRINKRILALCIGNHTMYMERRRPESVEVQQMKAQAQEEREARKHERERVLQEMELREQAERERNEMIEKVRAMEEEALRARQEIVERERLQKELEVKKREAEDAAKEIESVKRESERLQRSLFEQVKMEQAEKDRIVKEIARLQRLLEEKNADAIHHNYNNKPISYATPSTANGAAALTTTTTTMRSSYSSRRSKMTTLNPPQIRNGSASNSGHYVHFVNHPHHHHRQQQQASHIVDEASAEDEMNSEPMTHELEVNINAARPEETRRTAMDCAADRVHEQLESLKRELRGVRDPSKVTANDVVYEENIVARGADKYKTLKKIREGTVKRRIDEFEAM